MAKLHKILLGTSAAVFALGTPVFAQDTGEDEGREGAVQRVLGPVTVTATKKADVENVQDVPIAVTAFNADTLDALNVQSIESLSFSVPNVSFDDIATARGTANFSIRGLGINSSIASIDPAVGVFIDGVYLGVNNGVVFDLFDIDSVEVLRGPQGILFGRNTTGGAVLINTGNPTDEFTYKVRATFDGPIDDDRGGAQATFQGTMSGPLIEDQLNGKIGLYYNTDAGYFKNLAAGDNHGEAQNFIIRGGLEWTPSETVTFLAKLEYGDLRGDGPSAQNRGLFERDSFDISIDNPGLIDAQTILGSLRTDIDVEFGNGTITNIFGYRSYEHETAGDIDALNAFLFHTTTLLDQEQFSNELRYAGTFGKAEVTTGIFYFDQSLAGDEVRLIPPPFAPAFQYGGGDQDSTVFGIFAAVDYAFTDRLTGTFGLRYSDEEKEASITYVRPRSECSVVNGTCPTTGTNALLAAATGGLVQEPNGYSDSNSWSNVSPKVGLQYFVNDNTQIYGSYTKGFRSGGYNFRVTDVATFLNFVNDVGQFSFDEEEVDAFEAGLKYQSADGRFQLNSAIFLTEISDMQREVNVSDPGAGVVQNIFNTADATLTGLELEGRLAVTDNLLLTGNIGLINAEYDEVRFDISGDGLVNGTDLGLEIPRVPESTWGFGALYDLDLQTAGAIVARFNFQHRDEIAYTDNNFGFIQAADMLDANVTWETPYEGLSIAVFGKNLLDEVQAGGDTQIPFGGPRSNGVNAAFDDRPAGGTFSPLKKGRVLGIEFTFQR